MKREPYHATDFVKWKGWVFGVMFLCQKTRLNILVFILPQKMKQHGLCMRSSTFGNDQVQKLLHFLIVQSYLYHCMYPIIHTWVPASFLSDSTPRVGFGRCHGSRKYCSLAQWLEANSLDGGEACGIRFYWVPNHVEVPLKWRLRRRWEKEMFAWGGRMVRVCLLVRLSVCWSRLTLSDAEVEAEAVSQASRSAFVGGIAANKITTVLWKRKR